MRIRFFCLLKVVLLLLASACTKADADQTNSHGSPVAVPIANPAFLTEADLEKLLVPGSAQDRLFLLFGAPATTNALPTGAHEFVFEFQNGPVPRDLRFLTTQLTVLVSNRVIVGWRGHYREIPLSITAEEPLRVDPCAGSDAPKRNADIVSLRIVSSVPSQRARYINTKALPQLGYVAADPALRLDILAALKETKETFLNKEGRSVTN